MHNMNVVLLYTVNYTWCTFRTRLQCALWTMLCCTLFTTLTRTLWTMLCCTFSTTLCCKQWIVLCCYAEQLFPCILRFTYPMTQTVILIVSWSISIYISQFIPILGKAYSESRRQKPQRRQPATKLNNTDQHSLEKNARVLIGTYSVRKLKLNLCNPLRTRLHTPNLRSNKTWTVWIRVYVGLNLVTSFLDWGDVKISILNFQCNPNGYLSSFLL